MAKKLLATLAALCLLLVMGSVGASAELYTNTYANGEFHILVISDAHQLAEEDANLTAYIDAAIKYMTVENRSPIDMVLFLGDSVTGSGCASEATIRQAVGRLLAPLKAANIPFTLVFGDQDYGDIPGGAISRADLLDIWKSEGGGLFLEPDEQFASADAGATNFCYTIKKNVYKDEYGKLTDEPLTGDNENELVSSNLFAQLFLFDTGSKNPGETGYDYVRTSQLDWFKEMNNPSVPAYVFQHIPVQEIYTNGYFVKSPFNLELPGTRKVGDTSYMNLANYTKMIGMLLETPSASGYSDGWFETITAPGNVQAAFFGNNPKNNIIEKWTEEGIDLLQLPGAAWNGASSNFMTRGGTFVTLRETNPFNPNIPMENKTTYGSDYFTYRQASRVQGSGVTSTINGFGDFIQIFPYMLQNLLIAICSPFRSIG